jgi:threonylcarbamoyladenosine tRNA methylthiotransferase MtaB
MTIDVVTFGCRLNSYESEVMKREAEAAGSQERHPDQHLRGDGEAVRQARQAVRKAKRDNPDARIIVTGCAAQTETDTFSEMDEVDLVLGNTEKLERKSYADVAAFRHLRD